MPRTIRYLNTDLDLKSDHDLDPVVAALSTRGVAALYPAQFAGERGGWGVTFESATSTMSAEPEVDLAVLLAAVEALPPAARAAWDAATLREFNLGYDCGDEPWAFNNGLSVATLRRIAGAGATLRITMYPARDEDDDDNGAGGRETDG
jgi:hypothetical protein